MHSILTAASVDSWLRVDSEETELIELGQLVRNDGCLRCRLRVGPGKCGEVTQAESAEESAQVCQRLRLAPQLVRFLFLQRGESVSERNIPGYTVTYGLLNQDTIAIQLTISW